MAWGTATGGDVDTTGTDGYHYHVFETTADLTVVTAGDFELLVVGGGGNGNPSSSHAPGGGGGGGVLTNIENLAVGAHTATVSTGVSSNSELGTLLAYSGATSAGSSTASGGGGLGSFSSDNGGTGGAQGNNGGNGQGSSRGDNRRGGGGGGAGTAGTDGGSVTGSGAGGDGIEVAQFADYGGSPAGWFGAGGGGHGGAGGGQGGGVAGATTAPIAHTGAGGNGNRSGVTNLGAAGIVIVRWREPFIDVEAVLAPGIDMLTDVTIVPPLTNVLADLSLSISVPTHVGVFTPRVIYARRSVIWTHDLDGTRNGAIP